jgi:hypothetical protein
MIEIGPQLKDLIESAIWLYIIYRVARLLLRDER